MAELDFDELDRAVNSLMSQAPVSVPAKQDDDVTTVELPDDGPTPEPVAPVVPIEPTPTPAKLAPAVNRTSAVSSVAPAESKADPVPAASTPPEVKPRRGRFMDMVHPSAVKENADKLPAPSARPSREAKTIEPHSSGLIADIVKKPAKTPESEKSDAPASPVVEPSEVIPETPDTAVSAASTSLSPAPAGSDFSAFLPDAKVEKRPLGQPTPPAPAGDTAVQTVPEPSAPAEYDQQLMAIESGATKNEESVQEAADPNIEAIESPVTVPEVPTQPEATPEVAAVVSESKPTGPTSIAQQYQEQPSSSVQTNGAIYDTATYHQPLSHPAKKSSGWLWVILIVAIILIGAGAGAYLYLNNI